jgi:tetrapyrrole methylase family protein/MazG family protein
MRSRTVAEEESALETLRSVVRTLRGPNGCPWDRAQTHETLRPYLLEEAHEAAEAILSGDSSRLAEELGDVLLHVFLHARLAEERGEFDVEEVARVTVDKLRRRHPHVFGNAVVDSPDEVRRTWERMKREEPDASGALDVPRGLPVLFRARRIQERAAAVGFDWPDTEGVLAKTREELCEIQQALATGDHDRSTEELGDLLFAVVNLSRFLDADPERALGGAIERFVARFQAMERELETSGTSLIRATPEEMDAAWERVKKGVEDAS